MPLEDLLVFGPDLPLGVGLYLARVLNMSLDELVPLRPVVEDEGSELDSDVPTVGSCLASCPEGISRDGLADALGWTLARVEHALRRLDSVLGASGMRLEGPGGRVRIEARPGIDREALARARRGGDVSPLDPSEAFALFRVATRRRLDGYCEPGEEASLVLGLESRDMIVVAARGAGCELSEEVRFSLCVDRAENAAALAAARDSFERAAYSSFVKDAFDPGPTSAAEPLRGTEGDRVPAVGRPSPAANGRAAS